MENRTKFNLEKSITIWKKELSQNSNMTRDNIYELESHLLDEITELENLGLSPKESLIIAKNRIGDIQELTTEFSKVNNNIYFKNNIIQYLKGILHFIAFITITELITYSSIIIANKIGINKINLISISLLILITFVLVIFSYKKYINGRFNIQKLTNIPILVSLIIVSKIMTYLSMVNLPLSIGVFEFGVLQTHLTVYKLLFGILILTISCIIFYSVRKENKVKIAK